MHSNYLRLCHAGHWLRFYLQTNGPTLSLRARHPRTGRGRLSLAHRLRPAGPGHPGKAGPPGKPGHPGYPEHSGQSGRCDLAKALDLPVTWDARLPSRLVQAQRHVLRATLVMRLRIGRHPWASTRAGLFPNPAGAFADGAERAPWPRRKQVRQQ